MIFIIFKSLVYSITCVLKLIFIKYINYFCFLLTDGLGLFTDGVNLLEFVFKRRRLDLDAIAEQDEFFIRFEGELVARFIPWDVDRLSFEELFGFSPREEDFPKVELEAFNFRDELSLELVGFETFEEDRTSLELAGFETFDEDRTSLELVGFETFKDD